MPLSDNLIAYYSFDESWGGAIDLHISGYHMTGIGGTIGSSTNGKVNNCRDFETADENHFAHGRNNDLKTGNTDFSYHMWVNLESIAEGMAIIDRWSTVANDCLLWFTSENKLQWWVSNGTIFKQVTTTDVISTGEWTNVACGHNASLDEVWISINAGTPIVDTYTGGGHETVVQDFNFGGVPGGNSLYYDGLADEFSYWKRDIRDDLEEFYNNGDGRNYHYIAGIDRPLSSGLVSYWPLDETSGGAIDYHGMNNLAQSGGTIVSSTGRVGNSRDFEYVDTEYFIINDNSGLSAGDIDFTIQAWVYLESKPVTDNITAVGKYNFGISQREYLLFYRNQAGEDRFSFTVSNNGITFKGIDANNLGSPSTGTWYLLHGWHDSINNTINISVNAGVPDTITYTSGVLNGTSHFSIGAIHGNTPSNYWDGLIDECGFWKRTLDGYERFLLYNNGSGRNYEYIIQNDPAPDFTENLISYWPLDEISGDAIDAHGINNLTETGGTIVSTLGKVNNCRDFEFGDIESFTIADNADLSTGDIDFTIAYWVKFESFTGFDDCVSKDAGSAPNREYITGRSTVDRIRFGVFDSAAGSTFTQVLADTLGSPSVDTWYFVICWHDSVNNTLNIQVNNGGIDILNYSNGCRNGTSNFTLGARSNNSSNHLDGLLDEVVFWKRLLNGYERELLYNNGSGRDYNYIAQLGGTVIFSRTKRAGGIPFYSLNNGVW